MNLVFLPPTGSSFYQDPSTSFATLPNNDATYTIRLSEASGVLYYFNGAAWVPVFASAGSSISASSPLSYNSGTGVISIALATNVANGYLSSADWSTFNGKQSLIVATTSADYYRGDKTFQNFNTAVDGHLSGTAPVTYSSGAIAMAVATAIANGYLSSTDWATFNGKQDLIVATTSADYYRGDKTFQNLNSAIDSHLSATAPVTYTTGVVAMPKSTGSVDGYLASADWTTFNGKEPAISGGTTAQYWRGDKTFQTLNMPAMSSVVSGASPGTGAINEVLTATQATNTTTGVGSSGSYGNVISVSLTAGRWMVFGAAAFNENGADLTTGMQCGISASSSGAGLSEFDTVLANNLISSTSDQILATPPIFVNISSPTTYYLNTKFSYTSGTPQHRGKITGLRIG